MPMNLNLTTATRIGLNLLALLGISVSLYLGASIFIPLTIALLMASVLYPGARFLHDRLRFPWFFSCLSALMGVIVLALILLGGFAIAIPRTIEGFPKTEEEWRRQYLAIQQNISMIIPYKVEEWLPRNPDDSNVFKYAKDFFSGPKVSDALLAVLKATGAILWQAILVMFITLFLMLEGQMLADKVRNIFGPSKDVQNRVSIALAEMAEAIRTYLVWRTIVNLGLGLILGAVYNLVELRHWYLWALLVIVLSYVPYLGTIAAGIPPILDALLFVDPLTAIFILVFYTGVVTFEGYIIVPWVMGRSLDLNASTVLFGCLFWDLVWGMAGLFLAMPILAAIKSVCQQVDGWQGWGDLMSSGPPKPLSLEAEAEANKARLEAIAQSGVNGTLDATVVMDDHQPAPANPGGSPPPGAPKSNY
jgi:predicted PurR-regulated permease PerM